MPRSTNNPQALFSSFPHGATEMADKINLSFAKQKNLPTAPIPPSIKTSEFSLLIGRCSNTASILGLFTLCKLFGLS
jgi:hypothetical protein